MCKSFAPNKYTGRVEIYSSKCSKLDADLSTLTVSPCLTRFHCLSHGLTVGSSFLTVFQILSEFSLELTIS